VEWIKRHVCRQIDDRRRLCGSNVRGRGRRYRRTTAVAMRIIATIGVVTIALVATAAAVAKRPLGQASGDVVATWAEGGQQHVDFHRARNGGRTARGLQLHDLEPVRRLHEHERYRRLLLAVRERGGLHWADHGQHKPLPRVLHRQICGRDRRRQRRGQQRASGSVRHRDVVRDGAGLRGFGRNPAGKPSRDIREHPGSLEARNPTSLRSRLAYS
jgi:hypothetical protein